MEKIKKYIKVKLNDIKLNEDRESLEHIYLSLDNLEKNKISISYEFLEEIENSIDYLDQKYDDFYELVNLFVPIKNKYMKIIKENYVQSLREKNRIKRTTQ